MNTDAMALYANSEDVKSFATLLQNTLPGTHKLSESEALALAQIALAHGLDPYNGEAWYLKDKNGNPLGIMVGIKGLRKCAKREAGLDNSVYWLDHKLVSPEIYNEPEGSIVYEAHLRDTYTTQAYAKSVNAMTTAGVPWADANDMLGNAPVIIGVGIAKPSEPSKMGIHQRARKRAEADALKIRYGVEFVGAQFTADEPDVFDGEIRDIEDIDPKSEREISGQPDKSEGEILGELGYDPPADGLILSDKNRKALRKAVNDLEYDFEKSDPLPIQKMSLETAQAIKNRDGVRYGDLPTDKLSHMYNALVDKLKDPEVEDREEKELKRDAAKTLMDEENK